MLKISPDSKIHQVSEVMAQIAAKTSNLRSIYDPIVGSVSLLLTVKKHLRVDVQKDLTYCGQEKHTEKSFFYELSQSIIYRWQAYL